MMFGLVYATALTALAAWLAWAVIDAVMGLRRNIKAARESGLRWFVARKFFCMFSLLQSQGFGGVAYIRSCGGMFSKNRWLYYLLHA